MSCAPALGMVQLLVRLLAPSEQVEDIVRALRTVMRPAQLHHACLSAQVWRGLDDERLIVYSEEWTDVDTFRQQLAGERVGRLLNVVEAATEAPDIEVRMVIDRFGFEYIAAARLGVGADRVEY